MREGLMTSHGIFSVLGLFDGAQQLLDAIPVVKTRVKGRLEAYTPYPVHGIDEALGLRKSPVGGMIFIMGVIGAVSALAFELWTSGVDYPLMTAGKPYFSWQAFVPIMFEVTVLFATFTAGLGMLFLLNRLPYFRHPMLRSKSMPLITRDKFALAVEVDGHPLDVEGISALLRDAGARTVEVIEQPDPLGPISPRFLLRVLVGIAIACFVAGYLTYWAVKLFPVLPPMVHMLDQPRLDAERQSGFFADGSGMRMPVAGTVARGALPYRVESEEAAAPLGNPLPTTESVLKQGRQGFMTYCSVCHGILGNGEPTLTAAYGAQPSNLVSQQIRDYPDGKIYHVIMMGKNAMPSYAGDLTVDERWAVIHYIRALQRALNAKDEDIPEENAR
jgi:mono/diheme cytochrome c family protein